MSKLKDVIRDDFIGYLISIAGLRYRGETLRRLKLFDVTPEQWVVLNRLADGDGVSQRELADRIAKDQPNTTRILDKMEQKGLIRRDPHLEDRRAFRIFLTEQGSQLRERILPVVRELRNNAGRGFSKGEITMLQELLRKFLANLD